MKNLHAKLKNHGKKVIIHLKRHHRKYLFGALCSGILALIGIHTASTINSIFANDDCASICENNDDYDNCIINCTIPVTPTETIPLDCAGCPPTTFEWTATIEHFTWDIVYEDTNWKQFTGIWTIRISSWDTIITILDRNLWASIAWTWCSITESWACWYHFQRWNNYWFEHFDDSIFENAVNYDDVNIDASAYWPDNYYVSWVFIKGSSWENNFDWSIVRNDNLWWWSGDFNYENWVFPVDNPQDRQWPCPEWYHIPSKWEWAILIEMVWNAPEKFRNDLLIPAAWYHRYDGNIIESSTNFMNSLEWDRLWSSSPNSLDSRMSNNLYYNGGMWPIWSISEQWGRANGFSIRCFQNKSVDSNLINFYDDNELIWSWNVISWTSLSESIVGELSAITKTWYTLLWWYESGASSIFDFTTPINANLDLYAMWIDNTNPTCDVEYSTTWLTNQDIIAFLTWCSEENIICTNCDSWIGDKHTFTWNDSFTFEFQDLARNTWSATATVTWIDKTAPTCDVAYSTTWATTWSVTATLTGCSEEITWTDTQHTFTWNWTYTFNFQDLAGNTWSTGAEVTWIISWNNIVYFDTEWNEFIWNDLTICNPNKTGECITMMDRNLWATTHDISKTGSYWYYYQWWNNYWFNARSLNGKVWQVDVSAYWPNNPYNSGVFLYWYTNRDSWGNDNLRWWSWDSYNNHRWWDNRYSTAEDRQWPCPNGYHVPSIWERNELFYYWYNSLNSKYWVLSTNYLLYQLTDYEWKIWEMINEYFYIPTAGNIITNRWQPNSTGDLIPRLVWLTSTWITAMVWSSTPYWQYDKWWTHGFFRAFSVNLYEYMDTISAGVTGIGGSEWLPIRCFKNSSDTWNRFSIVFDDNIKPGEYTTFTVKATKDWQVFKDYTGTISFILTNKSWGLVNKKIYTLSNSWRYTFELSDQWIKVFYSWLKINQTGTYTLEVNWLNDGFKWAVTFNVWLSHSSANFEYDTLKFNPNYSNEMNEAYQYARYYDITTKNTIKDADMYSWLNRIAMAKMLTNYAENVLWVNNYNTGRNCKFVDVSTSLDKDYDYWVTKACQLWIMWVNMPNNKFYPEWWVTRAEFATALSRLLYGTADWVWQYYSTHLVKLYKEKIITNTDPTLKELRGYVMLMLKRAAE